MRKGKVLVPTENESLQAVVGSQRFGEAAPRDREPTQLMFFGDSDLAVAGNVLSL